MAFLYAFVTVAFCLGVHAVIRWSDAHPDRPIWPPLRFGAGMRVATWAITVVAIGAAYFAGTGSWNAWGLPNWLRLWIGAPLAVAGSWFSSFAMMKLGLDNSMGARNGLVIDGLFAFSRNPTYLGNLALCLGWVLLAASTPALVSASALATLYIAAVPHEERWLARVYGDAYRSYRNNVRRWF